MLEAADPPAPRWWPIAVCRRRPLSPSEPHFARHRRFAVSIYGLTTVLLFSDQNLMAPNLSAMADEFGFDNTERDEMLGGNIALAFFCIGAPVALIIGLLADKVHNRAALFGFTVLLGEGSCLATAWTTTYAGLYACRVFTGIGVGGALPLLYSLLGDWYAADQRSAVSGFVAIGSGVGIALGQGVAGFVGPLLGWRAPFVIVSLPALACVALLMSGLVLEPERGCMDGRTDDTVADGETCATEEAREDAGADGIYACTDDASGPAQPLDCTNVPCDPTLAAAAVPSPCAPMLFPRPGGPRGGEDSPSFCGQVNGGGCSEDRISGRLKPCQDECQLTWKIISLPSVLLILVQGVPGCVPWGIINTFLNDYLSADGGMTVQEATLTVMSLGVGSFFGLILGGYLGQRLYNLSPRLLPLLMGTATITSCLPLFYLFNSVDVNTSTFTRISVSVTAGLLAAIPSPNVKALLQNVTLPETRGRAFAFQVIFDDLGRGIGPLFVAQLIKRLGRRQEAFNYGLLGFIFCGLLQIGVFFTVKEDETYINDQLVAKRRDEEKVTADVGLRGGYLSLEPEWTYGENKLE